MKFYRKYKIFIQTVSAIFIVGLVLIISKSITPSNFPSGKIVVIPPGTSISGAASLLSQNGIIRSVFTYKAYTLLLHDGKGVQAGSYLFDEPQSLLRVAYRTAYGIQGLEKIKVTIYEGSNSKEIAKLLANKIPDFDEKSFLALAKNQEGYLFPDTYYFNQNLTPKEAVNALISNFKNKITNIASTTLDSKRSLEDIMIMASIVEEEENNTADRKLIAGILWKRIAAGMSLQVDAPFYYILNKASHQLTQADLATTSPYNTYNHKGLPPTPISNPGLDSIMAAANPEKSPYWFYLADSKGVTHYAETLDGHIANREKYLR